MQDLASLPLRKRPNWPSPNPLTVDGQRSTVLQHRLAQDLVERRAGVSDLLEAGHPEGHQPLLDRLSLQFDGAGAGEDHVPDLVGEAQHLVEPDAALVARLIAALAAAAPLDLDGLDLVGRLCWVMVYTFSVGFG